MENELQITSKNQCSLSNVQIELCKELYHVNQLTSFSVNDERIIEWSKSLSELVPNLDAKDLHTLINDFKLGELEYNQKEGIQNIIKGLKELFYDKYFRNTNAKTLTEAMDAVRMY